MSSQRQNKTPQPTPGHSRDYSQVADDDLVVLTDDSTDTEHKKTAERKAKREEAKRQKVEEAWQEVERRQREEEEVQRKKAVEEEAEKQRQKAAAEEAERQRQRASKERAQARQDEAAQRLCGMVYDVNTAQKVPGASVVERATETEEADDEWEAGGEDEEEPGTPLEGPSGVSSWWTEWERERQLQAAERYAAAHEKAATAFERMAKAVEWMAEAAEWTANEWGMYHAWAEWAEMRRREDAHEARLAELERMGGGWKRPQSEAAEDQQEEADEGVEGDNEEEVKGEQEGGEEQEGGREQAMEE
ncbi:hypothetical protein M404DRAFT_17810 [Pisolithus tinctorius Marx 270]|uniref:Uncharacterized protein n=1 Tax=Pisolithus tinctorius Marx 270 TaxID=870435 RepID=A0A0C3KZQ8_PISTI|nr:hypothetical protein M404DRAFT_17810 [Pisolithus tinctorius Marx 270]